MDREGGERRGGGACTTLNTSNTAHATPRPMIRRCMGLCMIDFIVLRETLPSASGITLAERPPVLSAITTIRGPVILPLTFRGRVLHPLFALCALCASEGD